MTTAGETTAPLAFEFGPAIDELAKALVTFQDKVKAVAKTKTAKVKMNSGGEYTYDYADLADVIASTREARTAAGLAVVQMPTGDANAITVVTTVLHSSGQWMRGLLTLKPTDAKPQTIGSLITYMRRYSYSAALGICTEADDDGNAAQGNNASTGGRRAEGKAPAQAAAFATPAAGKTEPTTPAVPGTAKPGPVRHDGSKATPGQIKLLHTLKSKLGMQECDGKCARETVKVTKTKGNVSITVYCVYHAQLAKFTDQAGKKIGTSRDLAIPQMDDLIDRYKKQVAKMEEKTANLPDVDLGAVIREPGADDEEMSTPGDITILERAAFARWGDSTKDVFPGWLKDAFDYDSVFDLRKDEVTAAAQMIRDGK